MGRRDGETERQRDRETERQRDRETERQRDRETERRRDGETEGQRDGENRRFKLISSLRLSVSLSPLPILSSPKSRLQTRAGISCDRCRRRSRSACRSTRSRGGRE